MKVETDGTDATISTKDGARYHLSEDFHSGNLKVLLIPDRGADALLIQPSSGNAVMLSRLSRPRGKNV